MAPGEDRVNILLVDDQPAKLLAYEAVLSQLGENLIKVKSAAEAMEVLLRTSVAVVLVDVCMPETDGFDLTALIRSHPRFHETAIIMVSGVHLNDLDRLRGYDLGAVDYIPVPVVPEMLLAKVRVFIDLFRKTRRLREMNRELERRVAERTRELRRSNEELRQFAYVASHDLQEPLRMVSSFVDLFLRRHGKGIGSDGEELLRYVVDGVQRMRQLINDLLAYARLERSPSTAGNVDFERALASALENLQVALEESGARVTHGPLPHVRGDEPQIVQLLQNLIGNSIKFRRPDAAPRINLQAAQEGDDWTFTLEDNGIGIDPEHRERVFQVFQRLNPREQYPGTGIGLAICRKIVDQHLGRIWIGAARAPGAVFHFTLPKAEDLPPSEAPATETGSPQDAEDEHTAGSLDTGVLKSVSLPDSPPVRVMVVDDDPAFRRLCGVALETEGIEHVAVGSSVEALKALDGEQAGSFDLILLDMELPGMKGWELLKVLRDRGRQVPVVLVSVLDGVEEKVRALDLGADDYIVKPCSFDELLLRLHAVLRRIRSRAGIQVGNLDIDPLLRRVRQNGRTIDLTPREFELLLMLVNNKGEVVSSADFQDQVWQDGDKPKSNFMQVHVSRLKNKLRALRGARIETVAGRGYRLAEGDE